MSSEPPDPRRAMAGLAAILIVAAAVVTVGISLQRRPRDPEATPPPASTPSPAPALSPPPRVTPTIDATAAMGTTTTSVPATVGSPAAPPPTLAVKVGTVTGNGVIMVAADRRPLRVVDVSLVADPVDYTGPCPTTIRFHGTIRVQGHGRVSYRFPRHDHAQGPVETVEADSTTPARVESDWRLGRQPENPHDGWVALEVLAPQLLEPQRAPFRVTCTP